MKSDKKIIPDTASMNKQIWATALRLGEFSYLGLAAECQIDVERATPLVRGWMKMGLVEFKGIGTKRRHVFALTALARRVELPSNLVVMEPVATAAENLWRSARVLQAFCPLDLAVHSTTAEVEVSEEDAARFCQMLLKGAYLRVVRKAAFTRKGGSLIKKPAVYRLIRNTGPCPPVERRVAAIYDPNLAEYTYIAGGEA